MAKTVCLITITLCLLYLAGAVTIAVQDLRAIRATVDSLRGEVPMSGLGN